MAASVNAKVRSFLWKRVKKSHGLTKIFWLIVCAIGSVVPVIGIDRSKELVKTQVIARVKEMLPGRNPEVAASIPGGDPKSPIRVYFTTPDIPKEQSQIAKAVVELVDKTQKTLDVCAFELDNVVICDAVVKASKRGVKVRCVTETDYFKPTEYGIKVFQDAKIPIVDDKRSGALMHDKFMIFDDASVWTGSMNFTENCAYKNNNNGIYIDDPKLAENYATKFHWMFDQHKFGSAPSKGKIPNPIVTLRDGTIIENYFATHDKVADHVITAVQGSNKSLHFLAFSFTHDGISKAMLTRSQTGVELHGVFEKSQTTNSYSEYGRMSKLGSPVEVYTDANPKNMHHKVIVIDGKKTIAGSFNFSTNADKSNDENLVIIHSPEVSKLFEEEFQRVFTAAKKNAGANTVALADR
jgi:phosphatidylserine/phosphatidylglycerophosphate/cardiolipin synthase-like enzyme